MYSSTHNWKARLMQQISAFRNHVGEINKKDIVARFEIKQRVKISIRKMSRVRHHMSALIVFQGSVVDNKSI